MFILKSLILVISFILSLTGRCPIFRCPTKPFLKGQFSSHEFLQDQEIYEVKQCKEGFQCNYLNKNKSFCKKDSIKKLPGDDCTKNSECYSNNCKDKVCKGKKEGKLCSSHFECNVGLACIEGKCQLQRKENEFCTEDFQCKNEMGCSQLGKCVKYMSLLQGEFSNFNILLCSNLTINENGYCVVSRLNQTTTECDDEQNVCEYFYDDGVNETNHTKNCSCSRGDGNKRYCPLDTVNEEFTKTRWKIDSIIFENRKSTR